MAAIIAAFLLCLLAVANSTNLPISFRGDVNTLLNCASGPRISPLSIQPRQAGDVWRPSYNRRNLTSFQLRYLDVSQLYGHLGDDYNPQLSQIEDPNRSNSGVEQPRIMITFPASVPNNLLPDTAFNSSEVATIRRWAMTALGCQLRARWTDLGQNFWPRWYTGRYCQSIRPGSNCSVPSNGQTCYPSTRELEFVTVLAWSCCDVAYPDSRVQYARTCGWRKVGVPLIRTCTCSCDPLLP